jgi:hypothetical protein
MLQPCYIRRSRPTAKPIREFRGAGARTSKVNTYEFFGWKQTVLQEITKVLFMLENMGYLESLCLLRIVALIVSIQTRTLLMTCIKLPSDSGV